MSVTRFFASVSVWVIDGGARFFLRNAPRSAFRLHNAGKPSEKKLSNLENPFLGPLRSTLGPLLGPEIIPKRPQVAPEEAPSARDSGEPVPGVPQ